MDLQISQPRTVILHLVPDREFLLLSELGQHIVFLRHGAQHLLVLGDHALGDIPLHSRLIAVLEVDRPIQPYPFAVPIDLTLACIEVHLIDAQIVYAEGMEHIIAPLLELPEQIAPLQGGHDKICRGLEHIRGVFQRPHVGVVHTVKADDPLSVIEGDHHEGADALPLQVLILEGVGLPDVLHILDDDMLADPEVPIPAGAYLRRDVLEVLLFRLHPVGRPLIGVVVSAGAVLFEDIGPFPIQRLPQMLQQHLQRLVRRLLQQSGAKALVDDRLQVLDALHLTVPLADLSGWSAFSSPFKRSPWMIHMPVLHSDSIPAAAATEGPTDRDALRWDTAFPFVLSVSRGDQRIPVMISCVPRSCQRST